MEELTTKTQGAQPGNQNAKKTNTSGMFACRLPDAVKDKIKGRAKESGISQAVYITLLVEANQMKTIWQIFTELVETEQISLKVDEDQTIWQDVSRKIEIIHCPAGLILSAVIGNLVFDSEPLAIFRDGAWWITDNALQKYHLWQSEVER